MEITYRIKVESVDGTDLRLDEQYKDGIECDGFVIVAHDRTGNTVAIHHMNVLGIAQGMADSDELMAGAAIAEGLKKSKAIMARSKLKGLAGLFGNGDD